MSEQKELSFLLEQLIKYRQNDMLMDLESGHATEVDYENLTNLIIEITRFIHDIRYCSKKDCSCSPEESIKLYYKKVKHILQGTNAALHPIPWKIIERLSKEGDSE